MAANIPGGPTTQNPSLPAPAITWVESPPPPLFTLRPPGANNSAPRYLIFLLLARRNPVPFVLLTHNATSRGYSQHSCPTGLPAPLLFPLSTPALYLLCLSDPLCKRRPALGGASPYNTTHPPPPCPDLPRSGFTPLSISPRGTSHPPPRTTPHCNQRDT